ncbi:MAG: helix-turn-helix transcriptional regulator [Clostridia bacterium]|nr:helix-turn-helix transcriptional regulator [Clostridia bacterium]
MISQEKIGKFLKDLRKEKGKTQEEIAEMYGISSRSVSRWENGNTLPDIGILVELADYYDVDVREIIDGERKSEKMDKDAKETLLKVADYANKQKRQAIFRAIILFTLEMICCGFTICFLIFSINSNGNVNVWFTMIPIIITISYSILLIMNAKDYVNKIQRK